MMFLEKYKNKQDIFGKIPELKGFFWNNTRVKRIFLEKYQSKKDIFGKIPE